MLNTFELKSPLGPQLIFSQATLDESVSGLFEFQIEAVSRMQSLDPKMLLGMPVSISRTTEDKKQRFYHGYCTRLEQTGNASPGFFSYRLSVKPWLWFLSRRSDSRIFQNKSIPDVLKVLFEEEPRAKFDLKLSGNYQPWEYCVQYRETALNFVTRLMEQVGIYYYFEHSDGEHKMVLCDNVSAHKPIDSNAKVPYFRPDNVKAGVPHISQWSFAQEIQPGKFSIDEYDPAKPSTPLFASRTSDKSDGVQETGYEIYDYPGEYDTEAEGRAYANVRLDELQTRRLVFSGAGDVPTLTAGRKFTLEKHTLKDQNAEYFVTAVRSRLSEGGQHAGSGQGQHVSMQFFAIKSSQQYRPARTTPKPIISGVQTALVSGPNGEEIYSDGQGRVRVQFFWDRYGKQDHQSSCWIRAAMPWASGQFGFMALPRIGDEVVVTFLEGDPDRPLITASVYNAENPTPYGGGGSNTKSGIRTKSSKGAGAQNFNEIFFEDEKGSELFHMQAEKDHTILVKHDRIEEINKDSHLTIKGEYFEDVGKKYNLKIGQDQSIDVGATYSLKTGQNWYVKSGAVMNAEAAGEIHFKSDKKIIFEAADGITLKVGDNHITIGKNGVDIKASKVVFEGQGKVDIKGSTVTVEGASKVDIKGAMVGINSGGSASSAGKQNDGAGVNPNAPKKPKTGKTHTASGKRPVRAGRPVTKPTSSAATLIEANKSHATFCEKCQGC